MPLLPILILLLASILCKRSDGNLAAVSTNPFPAAELKALQELYIHTNGDNWNWKTNYTLFGKPWNFTDFDNQNPCTEQWQGIYCYSNCTNNQLCAVGEISLSSYNLKGFLPASIGNFTHLVYMDFSINILSGTIPETVGNLSVCNGIVLSYNQLTGKVQSIRTIINIRHKK
jgi:hypothetical protein